MSPALLAPVVLLAAGCSGADGGEAPDGEVPAAETEARATRANPARARSGDRDRGWHGTSVEPPLTMPSVTLTDTRGRLHPLREEARGRVTLLFLGYTHCPDVCPVQMANLGAVLDELTPSVRRHLRVVFVTVDPARDSAARIRSWLDRFGDGFVGLRGSQREITALQDSLRLPRAARQDRSVQGRYTVGHASQVMVFGPDARARLAYPSGTRQRAWRDDLPRLVRETVDADPAGGG